MKEKKMKKLLLWKNSFVKRVRPCAGKLVLIAVIGLSFTGCSHAKETKVIPEHVFVYAENQAEDYPATKAAQYFADQVREKTDGRIEIVVKSNGALGDEDSVITQMGFGGVDFSRVSLSTLAVDIPELNVLLMPYLYASESAMWQVLDGEIGQQFADAIDNKDNGVHVLSWYDAGTRNFYSVKPISSISDLKGLNIRVQESDVMRDMVEILGANPVQMKYSEVYQGMQTGVVDGAENNWSSYEYSGHYQLAKYYIVDEHTRIPELQLISENAWSQLSDQDKEIVSSCAKASAAYERKLWQNAEQDARAGLEANGTVVTEISADEREEFQEAVMSLYDKYCSDYMDIIEEIRGIQ